MATEQDIYHIHPIQRALQVPARGVVDLIFPHQELDSESQQNLNQATAMLEDNFGMVIPINHFAKPEFMYLFSELFRNRAFSERGGLSILGAHENRRHIKWFAKAVGVDLMSVILYPDRPAYGMGNIKSRGKMAGMQEFMEEMARRLAQGGTVLAIPQGHRLPILGEPQTTLINDLLSTAENYEKAEKLAVMPIGISLLGKPNYEDQGFHFLERGIINVRTPRTREEINNLTGGNPKEIEKWTFAELKEAVLDNYL